jgi:hypothetical protein
MSINVHIIRSAVFGHVYEMTEGVTPFAVYVGIDRPERCCLSSRHCSPPLNHFALWGDYLGNQCVIVYRPMTLLSDIQGFSQFT